mgnify:CR=1 FL=1
MTYNQIFSLLTLLSFVELFIMSPLHFDLSIFNPIVNYKRWVKLNWFGVIIITFILNIVFIVYACCYWIYKLFTVGRRYHDENR